MGQLPIFLTMSIAVFISCEADSHAFIPWAARFARADETELIVAVPCRSKNKDDRNEITDETDISDKPVLAAVDEACEKLDSHLFTRSMSTADDEQRTVIRIIEFTSQRPDHSLIDDINELSIKLLILPARETAKSGQAEEDWVQHLLHEASCETMMIRGPFPDQQGKTLSVLVATQGESDTDIALERAQQLVSKFEGEMSLLFVRPDDNRIALQVARMQLTRLDQDTRIDLSEIPKTISLSDNFPNAVREHCQKNSYDLVLIGTRKLKTLRAVLRPWDAEEPVSVAAVRGGVPFTSRFWSAIQIWCRSRVPQLHREQRIKLIDRLQSNSLFDFDFIALTMLSTMIAALGLIQNSVAVVIGAMLVAPLMNPLAAIGYSLALGNVKLIRNSMYTVLFGFVTALIIGLLVGLMIQLSNFIGLVERGVEFRNSEIQARVHPNLLDWFVAFVSGIAAAYAMGRPKLLSALPGVAIAAALVPPIATSGLMLSVLQFKLSLGAFLLFFTNIVAIVLGTACAFWAVGIGVGKEKRNEGRQQLSWPRYLFISFVVLSIVLATTMSLMNRSSAEREHVSPGGNVEP